MLVVLESIPGPGGVRSLRVGWRPGNISLQPVAGGIGCRATVAGGGPVDCSVGSSRFRQRYGKSEQIVWPGGTFDGNFLVGEGVRGRLRNIPGRRGRRGVSVGEVRERGCRICRDGEVVVVSAGAGSGKTNPGQLFARGVRMDSAAEPYFLTMVTCRGCVAAALAAVISSIHSFMSSTPPWLQPEPA